MTLEAISEAVCPQGMPQRRCVDRNNRLGERSLHLVSETQHGEVGPDLEDRVGIGAVQLVQDGPTVSLGDRRDGRGRWAPEPMQAHDVDTELAEEVLDLLVATG